MSWAATELQHASLGDKRLNRRLASLVDSFLDRAEASIPQALPSWAATKAAYRFFDNDRVAPKAIIEAHAQAVRERLPAHRRLLAVQDTTDLNYTSHAAAEGLGYLQNFNLRGFFLHSTLAVSPEGLPLGLLDQQMWARPLEGYGKKHQRRGRGLDEKESVRWLTAQQASWERAGEDVEVVLIADREADLYALFAQERPAQAQWLVRVAQNRRTQAGRLFEVLAKQPVAGGSLIHLGRRGEQPPREAHLTWRYGPVHLLAPKDHPHRPELDVMGILVEEESPPPGEAPVCWRLLTSLPIEHSEEVAEVVFYYSLRWLIERFHYVLKSGCHVEELQLQTRERLERAVATYSIVAWRLLELTYAARLDPRTSCEEVLEHHEWQALAAHQRGSVPDEPPTLQEAVWMIAKLGGFLGRRHDGHPGVKVLWRGMRRLHDIAAAWQLAQSLIPPPLVGKA